MEEFKAALVICLLLLVWAIWFDDPKIKGDIKIGRADTVKIVSHHPIIPDTLLTTDGKKVDTLFIYKQPFNANGRKENKTQNQ